jgi:hypothetical protein
MLSTGQKCQEDLPQKIRQTHYNKNRRIFKANASIFFK